MNYFSTDYKITDVIQYHTIFADFYGLLMVLLLHSIERIY